MGANSDVVAAQAESSIKKKQIDDIAARGQWARPMGPNCPSCACSLCAGGPRGFLVVCAGGEGAVVVILPRQGGAVQRYLGDSPGLLCRRGEDHANVWSKASGIFTMPKGAG